MVSELGTVLVGVGGTILGYAVAALFNLKSTNEQIQAHQERMRARIKARTNQIEQQLESKDIRERAGFYLEKKMEYLTNLHEILVECEDLIGRLAMRDDASD